MSAEDTGRQLAALRDELREFAAAGRLRVDPSDSGRLRLSDVTRALLAAVSKTGGEHSTVRLTRNARGDTQIEVYVRTGDADDVTTVDEAAAKAADVYDRLALVYPHNGGPNRD